MEIRNLSPYDSECGGEIVGLYAVVDHSALEDIGSGAALHRFVIVMTNGGYYKHGALYSVWCDKWMKCAFSEEMKTKLVEAALRGDNLPPQ